MTIQRMYKVALAVDDLDAASRSFAELGKEPEGRGRSKASGLTTPSASTASGVTSR